MKAFKGTLFFESFPSEFCFKMLTAALNEERIVIKWIYTNKVEVPQEGTSASVNFMLVTDFDPDDPDYRELRACARTNYELDELVAMHLEDKLAEVFGARAQLQVFKPSTANTNDVGLMLMMNEEMLQLSWPCSMRHEVDGTKYGIDELIEGELEDTLEREREDKQAAESDDPEAIEKLRLKRIDQAMKKFDKLSGLESVKEQVREIALFATSLSDEEERPCLHMVFTGNPGTGKTEVARLIAEVFGEIGLIEPGKFLEVTRSGLIGEHVGSTERRVVETINRAQGGLLFVDEAHSLADVDHDRERTGGGQFGNIAINELVKGLEDNRSNMICIMAGYKDKMEQMLDINPGLRDRVGFYVDFPDYGTEELGEIFVRMVQARNRDVSAEAFEAVEVYIAQILSAKSDSFSNGRIIRKIAERVVMKHDIRTQRKARETEIEPVDIEAAFESPDLKLLLEPTQAQRPIGFTSVMLQAS